MKQKNNGIIKRYLPYTHIGVFVLLFGYLGYFLMAAYFGGNADAFSGNGTGTPSDPFQISNCEQLQELIENSGGQTYTLVNDIDCSDSQNWPGGFASIPTFNASTLDGRNHTISNIYIQENQSAYLGMFRQLTADSVVKNIRFEGGSIENTNPATSGIHYTGTVAGVTLGTATISNVWSNVTINTGSAAGGIVGQHVGTLNLSRFNGVITSSAIASAEVGGLAARIEGGNILDSYAVPDINIQNLSAPVAHSCGGLVGHFWTVGGEIYRSYSKGTVDCETIANGASGGLVGTLQDDARILVADSYTQTVVGQQAAVFGALIGDYQWSGTLDSEVRNNYIDIASGITQCIGTYSDTELCGTVNTSTTNPNYFAEPSNNPMAQWNYSTNWESGIEDPQTRPNKISPEAPQDVTATTVNYNSVDVSWNAPLDNGGANVTDYRVLYKETSSDSWLYYGQVNESTFNMTVTDLDPATDYSFKVQAENNIGYGLYSETALATTDVQPDPNLPTPSNLQRTDVSSTSIQVSWDAVAGASNYQVSYRASSDGDWTYLDMTQALSASVSDLSPATSYVFRVQAFGVEGSIDYSEFSAELTTSTLDSDQIGISNCTELQNINDNLSASYILDQNIDCSASATWNGGDGFEPIGNFADAPFTGSLDGNNFRISNLAMDRDENNVAIALFERTENATIQNLTLRDMRITGTGSIGTAPLIGKATGTNVKNIKVRNVIINSTETSLIGGVIGFFEKGSAEDLSATGTITADASMVDLDNLGLQGMVGGVIGGLIGDKDNPTVKATLNKAWSDMQINVALSNTEMYSSFVTGGVTGTMMTATLTNAYSLSDMNLTTSAPSVPAQGISLAGVAGLIMTNSELSYAYSTGNLTNTADNSLGTIGSAGIAGAVFPTSSVNHVFSTATLNSVDNSLIAGTVGASLQPDDESTAAPIITDAWHLPAYTCIAASINTGTGEATSPVNNSECNEIANSAAFLNTRSVAPIDAWDFRNTWKVNPGGFPTFTSVMSDPIPANSTAITNCEGLQAMRENLNGTYHLTSNINCSDTENWNNGQGFIPIGENDVPFTGVFDGRNYSIRGLFINYEELPNESIVIIRGVGLFGSINSGTVKNLELKDSSITTPQTFNANTAITGAIAGLISPSSKFSNLRVTNTDVMSGAITGGVFGANMPLFTNDPTKLIDVVLPNPETQKRLNLDNIHFSGNIDGIIAGGIMGASVSGLNVAKNNPDSYSTRIINSSFNGTVRAIDGGGILGLSYSLGSDPLSYMFYASLANGNLLEVLQIINAVNPAVNICDNPNAVPELVREQVQFYCGLAEQNEGFELAVIGTRIENTQSSGLITNCNGIIDFPLAVLGGISAASVGTEIRSSRSTATIATCPRTFLGEGAPDVTFGALGGVSGILLDSRIKDTHFSGVIKSNANNAPGPYAGISGGLAGLVFSIGDFNKRPMISDSSSTGSINLQKPEISISMSGGAIGLLVGSGTITNTHSTMDINNKVTKDVGDFIGRDFGSYLGEIVNGENEPLALTFSGGLVGTTVGINFPAILNNGSRFIESVFNQNGEQNIKLSRDYGLGNARGLLIKDSYSDNNVTGTFAGGILGSSNMAVDITKSYSEGEVTGTFAGGFVGNSGLIGTGLTVFNRTVLGSEVDICENGLGNSFMLAVFIDTATCGFSQIDELDPAQKQIITGANNVFRQLDITDSYSKANITGVPVKLNIAFDLSEEEVEAQPFLPANIRGVGLPTFTGGIAGFYSPGGGTIRNVYTSGNITTLPFNYTGEQTFANVVKPVPDMVGGFFGLNLATPEITIGRDNTKANASTIKNSFSANIINPVNRTWHGSIAGSILKPLEITDLVFNQQKNRSTPQVIEGVYYDVNGQPTVDCDGVKDVKQAVLDIGGTFNPEFGSIAKEDLPDEFTKAIGATKCGKVDTGAQPNYFINNTTNAPLNTWDFNGTWKTRLQDLPDFKGDVIDEPGGGTGGGGGVTPPTGTKTSWPTDVPVFGQAASGSGPAVELGKLPRIGSSPFLITGLNAKIVQGLPWLLLLVLSLLHLQQGWHQNQVNRRFKAAIGLSKRVKETLSGFLNITSHYLATPTATISTALELLVGVKAIQGERAQSLTASAKSLSAYVNDLTKRSQEVAAATEKTLNIPAREAAVLSMRKWVTIPVAFAGSILLLSLVILNQIEIIEVTRTTLLLNIALLFFAASLVYVTFRVRVNQEAANLALDRALAAEKAVVDQRKDLILEAESKLNSFAHQLALSNKTLEKSKNAKPYMNGLADLEVVTSSFHKVYKFATTNMPYASEVSPAVLEALAPIRLEAKTRHINLITDVPPDINTVFSLEEAHHIIYSLMDNALKFSAEGSTVSLAIESTDKQTLIEVTDHGIGIPKEKLDSIMQPFARATDTKKYDYEGMGLDLFITRILVEKYGGSINIKSKVDEGTTVTILVKK